MSSARESWVDRLARHLLKRQGPQAGDVRLGRRNIYILPSKAGLLCGAVLATMLIASINYQLSLGFALTFLLGSIALVAMLQTFRNLAAVLLRPGRAEPVFAGSMAEVKLQMFNRSTHERFALRLQAPEMAQATLVDLPGASDKLIVLAIPTVRRGWMPMPRFKLWTDFPLGLWRAWAYWHPASRVLVYPSPETPAAPLPELAIVGGEGDGRGQGEDDLAAVRPFAAGDSPRRIAWKAMARTGSDTVLVKQFEGGYRGDLLLDWARLPAALPVEARLSRLTRWVLDADASGTRYALRLPGSVIDTDAGPAHRQRCLEALATYGG